MKLVILKNNFKNILSLVGYAVGINPNIPVISNVLIKTEGNKINISTTNLEIGIKASVAGKVVEDGGTSVPYDVLSNIVNNISSERINLETRDNNLNLQTDNYEALIQGSNEEEFPIIPKIKETPKPLVVDKKTFSEAIEKTIIAAGTSDLRPEINGILLAAEPTTLKVVATDSFRLAEYRIGKDKIESKPEEFQVIIPLKTADAVGKILKNNKEDETISIYTDTNQIIFKLKDLELVSRVIDGNFPDYEAIVPKSVETEVNLSREELINALKLANSFTARIKDVNLKTTNKKTLEIYSGDSSLGENKYLISSKITGEDNSVTFNLRYLLDGIKAEDSKDLILGLNSENKPAVIKSSKETSYFYILMPIKVA